VLKELNYSSGAYVDDENRMYCTDSVRQVTMRFDSQWCRSIEMVFEGVIGLNLRPSSDNTTSFLYGASMFVQDGIISFYDSHIDSIDKSYEGTWIESFGLRQPKWPALHACHVTAHSYSLTILAINSFSNS